MSQVAMNFEAYPKNPNTYGTIRYRIFERAKHGITNREIVNEITCRYDNRIHEIRKSLHGTGWYLPEGISITTDGKVKFWKMKREGTF